MPAEVPRSLRAWFTTHFLVAWLSAIPLFVDPQDTLRLFGWITVDPVATRLVAAALLAIGARSWLVHRGSLEAIREHLHLELVWSFAAVAGLVLSAVQGAPVMTWALVALLGIFAVAWLRYALRLRPA